MLMMDGGDMEILDIKDTSDGRYCISAILGRVLGSGASTDTLYAIESIFKKTTPKYPRFADIVHSN